MSEEQVPVRDRATALRLAALAAHGYLDDEGFLLDDKFETDLFDFVSEAEVLKLPERKIKVKTRSVLTRHMVKDMPGPGDYEGTDDPEAAELAWSQVNAIVWRKLDVNANGPIQARFNGEGGLVLCRTSATGEKGVTGVYVTRDWGCLQADFIGPEQAAIKRKIDSFAANSKMGTERIPELGKRFKREFNAETKRALEAGLALIQRQIDAIDAGDAGDDVDDDGDDHVTVGE